MQLAIKRAWDFWGSIGKPSMVAAPMVRWTSLPCRMQLRRHGAELCSTPMIDADVLNMAQDRSAFFMTCREDRPLVGQLGATNVDDFIAAGKILEAVRMCVLSLCV